MEEVIVELRPGRSGSEGQVRGLRRRRDTPSSEKAHILGCSTLTASLHLLFGLEERCSVQYTAPADPRVTFHSASSTP